MDRQAKALLVAGLILVAGCENKEQTGAALGSSIGALACGVVGSEIFHNTVGTVLPAAACGAIGYFIGSSIGRQLDEQDRQQAASATERALAVPVKPPKAGTSRPVKARASTWKSDHGSGASGSAAVTKVEKQADGVECRTVREIAYIKGEEVTQNSRYCRGGEGEWVAVQA